MEPSNQQSSPAIPIAIVFGFAMIALAVFFSSGKESSTVITQAEENPDGAVVVSGTPRPIDDSDFIRGNPNAPILIVEYSDYDCPFCKQYHTTLNQVMDEYGITGQLGWTYRQYPLAQLHPNSPKISESALCVGDIGGNDSFWKFTDQIFNERSIDEPTNVTKLPEYAEKAGVSRSDYMACLESGRMKEKLEESLVDGFNLGVRGTPYTIVMVGDQQAIINGAQSYDVVKGIVVNLIDQLEGNFDPTAYQPG